MGLGCVVPCLEPPLATDPSVGWRQRDADMGTDRDTCAFEEVHFKELGQAAVGAGKTRVHGAAMLEPRAGARAEVSRQRVFFMKPVLLADGGRLAHAVEESLLYSELVRCREPCLRTPSRRHWPSARCQLAATAVRLTPRTARHHDRPALWTEGAVPLQLGRDLGGPSAFQGVCPRPVNPGCQVARCCGPSSPEFCTLATIRDALMTHLQ